MADQRINILTTIDDILTELRGIGQPLEGIKSHFVMYTAATGPPELGTYSPMLLVMAPSVESEDLTSCGNMLKKTMPVYFAIFTENSGDTRQKTASALLDAVETAFRRDTLGYSSTVQVTSKSFDQTSIDESTGQWMGAAELVLQYMYIDGEDGMYNTAPHSIGNLTLDGTASIPALYTTIRVQSTGGPVTMTALPTFSPPPTDGKVFVVIGKSDTNLVTFPDNSNTPGSGLRMINARDRQLGLNDTLVFQYDASQSVFVNLSGSDSY